jgi:hypothetical protein
MSAVAARRATGAPQPAAVRARRKRARRRQGLAIFYVEANEARMVEALLAAGRLTEAEALERPAVERELAKLLDDWARRWLPK